MSGINALNDAAVDAYLETMLLPEDPTLDRVLLNSENAGLEPIAVSPLQGAFLQILAKSVGARRILELGTLGGYSTIWLARALPDDGELVTMEVHPPAYEVACQNIDAAGLTDRVTIMHGRASDGLAELIETGAPAFDFIFVDADKANSRQYLELCLRLSCSGTLMVFDNMIRGGRIIDANSDERGVVGVRDFLDGIKGLDKVEATAVQTVGSKGHDGFALVRVK